MLQGSLLVQFRSFPLYLEACHFRNNIFEDRIFLLYDSQNVETEDHCVWWCALYSQLRYALYLKMEIAEIHGLSNENKFVLLNKYKCKELRMFCKWLKSP